MTRRLNPAELVGAAEIVQRLGLARTQTVHNWRVRHEDFPQPVAELESALIWYWPDIEKWARKTGRLPIED
jgi:predicted DNA-binding transcriptional regulator AlpA